MHRFKNILVVINANADADEVNSPALDQAIMLAQINNAKLTLMDTIEAPDATPKEYKGILKIEDITTMMAEKRTKALQAIADNMPSDVETQVKVMVGKDFIEIIRQLLSEHHDLLIKSASSSEAGFNSVDFNLMRKSPVPVWLIRRHQKAIYKLLAAIDLSLEAKEEGHDLNRLIMDLSTSLAKITNCECHVLSCWSIYAESALRDSSFIRVSDSELDHIYQQEKQKNRNVFDKLIQEYSEFDITTHLEKENPKAYISQFANDNSIDLVIMGTMGRTGIPGFFIGNTSETVLQNIRSSVLTVKPASFVSPVI